MRLTVLFCWLLERLSALVLQEKSESQHASIDRVNHSERLRAGLIRSRNVIPSPVERVGGPVYALLNEYYSVIGQDAATTPPRSHKEDPIILEGGKFRLRGESTDMCIIPTILKNGDKKIFFGLCDSNAEVWGLSAAPGKNSYYIFWNFGTERVFIKDGAKAVIVVFKDNRLSSKVDPEKVLGLTQNFVVELASGVRMVPGIPEDSKGKPIELQKVVKSWPTLDVSLGDSFIAGEGGRWRGNTADGRPTRIVNGSTTVPLNPYNAHHTDLGKQVYFPVSPCNRSTSAEIYMNRPGSPADLGARNLACSGALSKDVYGIRGQAEALFNLTREFRIRSVVLSVGGNDLGFSDILADCVEAYLLERSCAATQMKKFEAKRGAAKAEVSKAVQAVKKALKTADYLEGDYRFVLQSYPSPLASADSIRPDYHDAHNETRWTEARWIRGGCPFGDTDLNWTRSFLVKEISRLLREVAKEESLEFMDLVDLFEGHEVCSRFTKQDDGSSITEGELEWARYVWPGIMGDLMGGWKVQQPGEDGEFLHPNAVGQKALGVCLGKHLAGLPNRNTRCFGTRHLSPEHVQLETV